MFDKLEDLIIRFEEVLSELGEPDVANDQERFRKLMKEQNDLAPIVEAYKSYKNAKKTIEDSLSMLEEESDEEMREMLKEELSSAKEEVEALEHRLKILLLPKDPNDEKNVIVEIRVLGVAMAVALVFSVLVTNLTLKPIFDRPRPYQMRPELLDIIGSRTALPDDASFPSGHTSASFAGAVALFLQRRKYKEAGTAFGFSALAVACLIAFSRLYFYVHFPSDVFVGMIIGITGGILSWLLAPRLLPLANRFFDKFYSLFRKKTPVPAAAPDASAERAPAEKAPVNPAEAPADPADPVDPIEASADPVAANAPDPIQDKK